MIDKTISEIEDKVRNAASGNGERKQELLDLLAKLKAEIGNLEKTHSAEAGSIAGLAHASAQEATTEPMNSEKVENSVANLRSSVEGFEQSHPKLVQLIDSLSKSLASWGV